MNTFKLPIVRIQYSQANHYQLKYFFFLFSLLVLSINNLDAQTDPTQPNILIIIADDLGVDYTNGYMTNSLMPTTPHLDSLQESGVQFLNAWASPKCTPTRSNILSGLYGVKTGVKDTPGELDTVETTLFEAIEMETNGDYEDAVFGKWHLNSVNDDNDHPFDSGVDHFEGFMNASVPDYYAWDKVTNGIESTVMEYVSAHITTAAIDWIDDRTTPWFAVISHAAPHSPFHVPPAGTYTIANTNNNKRKYTAAIESMDYEIGRLFDEIDNQVLSNTVIIYIGDNGTPGAVLQAYGQGHGKNTLYQGGVHVPLTVTGAGVTRTDETEADLVHATDIYATCLQIVGDVSTGIGNSLSFYDKLTQANDTQARPYNYAEIEDDWTIRNDQYKLISREDCTEEFYDLVADELETNDLIGSLTAAQLAIKAELEAEALIIRKSWSCNDLVENGGEQGIDCGGSCYPCNPTTDNDCKEDNIVICDAIALDTFVYAETEITAEHELTSQDAILQAGDCINLGVGFEFTGGGTLEVAIDDCTLTGIDDNDCPNSNTTSTGNIGCCMTPEETSEYAESISGDLRLITTNNFPDHDYCYANNNNIPSPQDYDFEIDATPSLNCNITSILTETNNPKYYFGVALNGVIFAPAPATPFIFTHTETGEYNWDFVFEPTNNQGSGMGLVGLDCASAHTGPQGYHYHGNMFQYAEEIIAPGISTTTVPPADPIHIGWAADGFPILYRFGPDADGNLILMEPSYQLKYGNRPGDGISEPCGSFNGKYTNDYRFISCSGDLDECNGVERSITLTTDSGTETFDYFYVITDAFPQIPRYFRGVPDPSFD